MKLEGPFSGVEGSECMPCGGMLCCVIGVCANGCCM